MEICIAYLENEKQIDLIENEISEKVRKKLDENHGVDLTENL